MAESMPKQKPNRKLVLEKKTDGRNLEEFTHYIATSAPENVFQEYFRYFPKEEPKQCKAFKDPFNLYKNFSTDVPCLDEGRVYIDSKNGDYIHANWVHGYDKRDAYICTQAPKKSTVDDFWIMVWMHNVEMIIMIQEWQKREEQCIFQCFPEVKQEVVHGDFLIQNIHETYKEECTYTLSHLLVRQISTGRKRAVNYHHFSAWPDYDVPQNLGAFVTFYTSVLRHMSKVKGPLVVKCRDGVGQAGAFITIDMCVKRLIAEGLINVRSMLKLIRSQRFGSIHTESQYLFCHRAILEYGLRMKNGTGGGVEGDSWKMAGMQAMRDAMGPETQDPNEAAMRDQRTVDRESILALKIKREREYMELRDRTRADKLNTRPQVDSMTQFRWGQPAKLESPAQMNLEGFKYNARRQQIHHEHTLHQIRSLAAEKRWHRRNERALNTIQEFPDRPPPPMPSSRPPPLPLSRKSFPPPRPPPLSTSQPPVLPPSSWLVNSRSEPQLARPLDQSSRSSMPSLRPPPIPISRPPPLPLETKSFPPLRPPKSKSFPVPPARPPPPIPTKPPLPRQLRPIPPLPLSNQPNAPSTGLLPKSVFKPKLSRQPKMTSTRPPLKTLKKQAPLPPSESEPVSSSSETPFARSDPPSSSLTPLTSMPPLPPPLTTHAIPTSMPPLPPPSGQPPLTRPAIPTTKPPLPPPRGASRPLPPSRPPPPDPVVTRSVE